MSVCVNTVCVYKLVFMSGQREDDLEVVHLESFLLLWLDHLLRFGHAESNSTLPYGEGTSYCDPPPKTNGSYWFPKCPGSLLADTVDVSVDAVVTH